MTGGQIQHLSDSKASSVQGLEPETLSSRCRVTFTRVMRVNAVPGRKSLSWWYSSDIRLLGRLLINLPSFHSVGYTSAKCREKGGHLVRTLERGPNGGGHGECAFSLLCLSCTQEIPHPPLFRGGCACPGLSPEAFCSRLVSSRARVAVTVGPVKASCDGTQNFS